MKEGSMGEWRGLWQCSVCGAIVGCTPHDSAIDAKVLCQGPLQPYVRRSPDPRVAAIEHELGQMTASAELERLAKEAAERRAAALEKLLREVLPENMGGTPDLFGPDGGWDEWEARAKVALAPQAGERGEGFESLLEAQIDRNVARASGEEESRG